MTCPKYLVIQTPNQNLGLLAITFFHCHRLFTILSSYLRIHIAKHHILQFKILNFEEFCFLLYIKHCQKSHAFMISQDCFVFKVSAAPFVLFPLLPLIAFCTLLTLINSKGAESSCENIVCQHASCIHGHYSGKSFNDTNICIDIRGQTEKQMLL